MANITHINVNGTTYAIRDVDALTLTEVDQTYDSTSLYPQSGVAVAGALGTLATVATSGSYTDLSNKPTIPTTASGISYQPSASGGILDGATDVDDALEIVDGLTIPTITYGTSDPSGGSNGDIYIKVES